MAIDVAKVVATLTRDGLEPRDYFLVGDMVMFWGRLGKSTMPFALVIEQDDLGEACKAYLRSLGVPEYESARDIPAAPA